jgi:hypothetical protein
MTELIRVQKVDVVHGLSLIAVAVVLFDAYHIALRMYISDLDRPLVVEWAFLGSAVIACGYEFNGAGWKISLVGCLATLSHFLVGVTLACWLRVHYMAAVAVIKAAPDFSDLVGRDVYTALTTRLVGYGGCFATGMLIARVTLGQRVRKLLLSYFAPWTQQPCPTCRGCGHLTPLEK